MGFVHLHCRSAYSMLEGTALPQALVREARRLKMPSVALTDRNSMYGAVRFYVEALKAGIKPIIGMVADLDDGSSLTLLARNNDGYRNLCHLCTVLRLQADPGSLQPAGFSEEEDDEILPWESGVWGVPVFGAERKPQAWRLAKEPRLPREMLLSGRHTRGLVALSGGEHGLVNRLMREGKKAQAVKATGMLLSAFGEGNFFLELQVLRGDSEDLATMSQLASLGAELGIPVVATNSVLYLRPEDAPTALALAAVRLGRVSMHAGTGRLGADMLSAGALPPSLQSVGGELQSSDALHLEVGTRRYFKSSDEMEMLFKEYPQALANTLHISKECNVELPLGKPLFPLIDVGNDTHFSRLWKRCFAGATRLYKPLTEGVISRLKNELEVIETLGFSPYFLVVYDIAQFARRNDIPIMARGSAANSLVAYVLGITQVDPLANGLLFERFLNLSRAEFELPDIDLDLCWRRRDEVLHYIYKHYGRDHVATVGTHITFRLRSAWREMAKALGVSPGRTSYVASRLPELVGVAMLEDGEEESTGREEIDHTHTDHTHTGGERAPRLADETERRAYSLAKSIE
ncbi:MAG: PHP domain-containing protein, partial [Chloroflexota bacterium]|nr:PHP domain-containing protein [Chloroflexota bacterium]